MDIGKSNAKLSVVDAESGELTSATVVATPTREAPFYPHIDTDLLWDWFLEALAVARQRSNIDFIIVTAHGATAALIDETDLVLPILDYEYAGPDECEQLYDSLCDPFTDTYSPKLPHGLNVGRQLYWQRERFAEQFNRAKYLLPYTQFWSWRLTGIPVGEVTTIGSHTDLWNPVKRCWSAFAMKQGFDKLVPPFKRSDEVLGVLQPALQKRTGINADCKVLVGIHDSNASLLPYLKNLNPPFTVMSTGTWVIIFALGSPLDTLNPDRDCTANVNVYGEPVACARFMGGREFAAVAGDDAESGSLEDVERLIDDGVYALPSHTNGGGPFPDSKGAMVSTRELTGSERYALATLYCALLSDVSLDLCASMGDIIIEGAYAKNELFQQCLSVYRSGQAVLASTDNTGTTIGTAMLATSKIRPPTTRESARPASAIIHKLIAYRSRWRTRVERARGASTFDDQGISI